MAVSLTSAQSIRAKVIPQWPSGVLGGTGIDVTLSNGVYTVSLDATEIPQNSITFAMMQDISTNTLMGRDTTGTGDPEEITLNATLEFTGSQVIQRAALTGDVTALAGSNTTAIAANAVTYGKMQAMTANRLLGSGASGTAVAEMTLGTGLSFTGSALNVAGLDDGDIAAAASATNYTPSAATVEGHLSGIDTALGSITLDDSEVTAAASATNYTPSAATVEGHLSGIDTALGSSSNPIPSGTLMLFQQTAAPTGWTKETTHNDKALRVVSGTASSGGSVAFSTVFGKTATDGHTLLTTEIPSHTHTTRAEGSGGGSSNITYQGGDGVDLGGFQATDAAGGGGSHSHDMDIRVNYVDLIIASKD
jgi:microcystin-dependent protein